MNKHFLRLWPMTLTYWLPQNNTLHYYSMVPVKQVKQTTDLLPENRGVWKDRRNKSSTTTSKWGVSHAQKEAACVFFLNVTCNHTTHEVISSSDFERWPDDAAPTDPWQSGQNICLPFSNLRKSAVKHDLGEHTSRAKGWTVATDPKEKWFEAQAYI